MLRIGWSSSDFTPEMPALLQGQMYVRVSQGAADPLMATALALDGGTPTGRMIVISCDLTSVTEGLQEAVRDRVGRRIPNLPRDALVMVATHTHDAPVIREGIYPHPGGNVLTAQDALSWVADHAADAAVEAWERRVPRIIGQAFGHAVVGHNRRTVYADGLATMYGSTDRPDFRHVEGYEDHSLDMFFVWELDGRLTGVVLDVPCPAQVEEHLLQFSADYWHDVRVELRHRFGRHLHVLPLCGAAGDQSPHFLLYERQEAEMRRRRGLTERKEIAARVGDAVARALLCTPSLASDDTLIHVHRRLALPRRPITQEERDWAERTRKEALDRGDQPDQWWPRRLQNVIDRFDRGESMPSYGGEIHVLRLGDAVLATNPFELYLDYGLRIKARSPAAQTFVVQLAGGTGLYLPTERAVRGGHYGAHPAVAPVGPEGGHELVEATLGIIGELFDTGSVET